MRRQRALPIIGCGSLGLLALAIGACGSSSKTPVDASSPTDGATTDVHADTGTTDVPKDTGVDRGNDLAVDRQSPDVPQNICSGVVPNHQVIADFQGLDNSAFGSFGIDPVIGNTYVNAVGINAEDFGDQTWHLTGTVYKNADGHHDYFGLAWNCTAAPNGGCTLDVSQYAGISFTIKGSAGPTRNINLTLGRADDDLPAANAMCGSCTVPTDASSSEAACHGPRLAIPLLADPTAVKTVSLYWTDFVGGSPKVSADPHQLTGILWYFDDPTTVSADGGTATDGGGTDGSTDAPPAGTPSYSTDLVLDNIQFIPYP
jgi:hypothetical protein